jgi:hypothetical protein
MDLADIGWGGMDWIDMAQDTDYWRALLNKVMNHLVGKKYWEVLEQLHNWRPPKNG